MAEIEVREKYPQSMRLDHPNFGDVYRTVYAKGVITDFEKVQDNPIKVNSRVKMDVEGYGESEDYLPLFYHPKAQYWDDEDHQAQDFNEAGKYFEQACKSFRKGDEVAVMLRATKAEPELTPFVVMGFTDGVPRIGEAVVKVKSPQHFRFAKVDEYYGALDEKKAGPDGIDLKLEMENYAIGTEVFFETRYFWEISDPRHTWNLDYSGVNPPDCQCISYTEDLIYRSVSYYRGRRDYFFFVGPICYCVQTVWFKTGGETTYWKYHFEGCHHVSWAPPPGPCFAQYDIYINDDGTSNAESVEELETEDISYGLSFYQKTFAAIISKERLEEIIGSYNPQSPLAWAGPEDWWEQLPAEFVEQSKTYFEWALNDVGQKDADPYPNDMDIFTRPHSQEELQAAAMWPSD